MGKYKACNAYRNFNLLAISLALTVVAVTTDAWGGTPSSVTNAPKAIIKIPVFPFMSNYSKIVVKDDSKSAKQRGYYFRTNTPMVWLFNPKGEPVAYIITASELKKALLNFPAELEKHKVLTTNASSLSVQLKVLQQSSASLLPKLNNGNWVALFYESAGTCIECKHFDAILNSSANKLHWLAIKLTAKIGSNSNNRNH